MFTLFTLNLTALERIERTMATIEERLAAVDAKFDAEFARIKEFVASLVANVEALKSQIAASDATVVARLEPFVSAIEADAADLSTVGVEVTPAPEPAPVEGTPADTI
jgi:SepF-like predicted cell division protein (DUF552 family)